jgi:GNAT superfamily N-acetyltransferase
VASRLALRLITSVDDAASATPLALEYGRWAARVAKEEYGIDAEAETEAGLSTSLGELFEPRGRLYVAELDGISVGLGGLKAVSSTVAEIKRVYVDPSARGHGIGQTLVARLIDDARGLGFERIRLESATFMREAHSLYRRYGFVEIEPFAGSEFEHVPGAEEIQVFMELRLDG